MSLINKIYKYLADKYKIRAIYKIIRNDDNDFNKILEAYIRQKNPVLLVENNEGHSNEIVYNIEIGVDEKDICGFFAIVAHTLDYLRFAETLGLKANIVWGENTRYYDAARGSNVFLYYFNQINEDIDKTQTKIIKSKNVDLHYTFKAVKSERQGYIVEDVGIDNFAYYYRKYFSLNEQTKTIIDEKIKSIFDGKSNILGVHVRGTDFKWNLNDHPKFQGFSVYVDAVKKLMDDKKYDYVFLATDDQEALRLFQEEFGDKLIYYSECHRASGNIGVHCGSSDKYEIGLDILKDVYTLVRCDGLICGISQVSIAVRYIKRSLDEEYRDLRIIKSDINKGTITESEKNKKLKV